MKYHVVAIHPENGRPGRTQRDYVLLLIIVISLAWTNHVRGLEAPVASKSASESALLTRSFEERLERLDARAERIDDLSAAFEERKFTSLLKKPLVSTGRVRVKGSQTRWDTAKPSKSVMVTDAKRVRIFYPDRKTLEVYDVDRRLRPLIVSPLPRLEDLQQHFRIEPIPVGELSDEKNDKPLLAMKLTPLADSLRDYVTSVRVLIREDAGHVAKVEFTDADGDRTVLIFSKVKLNTGLSDRDVDLVPPAGTTITRPFEGVADVAPR